MKIRIQKFKKIDDVEVELSSINIFIGTNNSGKSSFIQGIQFATSACQTLDLLGANWVKGKSKTLALDSKDFLYTPTNDISYLYHGKRLSGSRRKEDRNWIEFTLNNGNESKLRISRGKNGGFTTLLEGKALGDELCSIENPYCVYVPGIAGIPVLEKYEVPIAVKKSATRGDSNNYLRNILYTINSDENKWSSFLQSVNSVYSDVDLSVDFDEHASEYIYVYVSSSGIRLPLDSVGTGLLQVIQIFAYIEYFSPKIVLLDEPDSHIHPTKQKELANELVKRLANNPELKVVFSTHSRYILEALENEAKVVHFQSGNALDDVKGSNILLDIGAADADYLFSKKNLKYVIVTEDKVDNISEKKEFIKKFLIANGLPEDEFVLHSYEGCTKVEFAKILQGFVRKQIPTAKVILHIDRDQKVEGDRELEKLKEDCQNRGILLFVTRFQEIESYFCTPQNIQKVYGITVEQAKGEYDRIVASLEEETRRKLTNFILRDRPELGKNKEGKIDIAQANSIVDEWYAKYGTELTPGKEMLGAVKKFAQEILKDDPNKIVGYSDGLASEDFQALFYAQ
ncbi:AAA family ATPase [Nodosilinea sp. LEGE 07298]|uniref:ATP-dependent nuclease n=1 Tax=Nodosilinea sp. LEGE 07298 TaxID=2777970 RepID=UPI00187E4254|nr:ATP-binding protein [Nodosilinea sp. LEGE 07298]MBE9108400.1 AAA family ATPase [Nodosilinea sp. LEGE 07298]